MAPSRRTPASVKHHVKLALPSRRSAAPAGGVVKKAAAASLAKTPSARGMPPPPKIDGVQIISMRASAPPSHPAVSPLKSSSRMYPRSRPQPLERASGAYVAVAHSDTLYSVVQRAQMLSMWERAGARGQLEKEGIVPLQFTDGRSVNVTVLDVAQTAAAAERRGRDVLLARQNGRRVSRITRGVATASKLDLPSYDAIAIVFPASGTWDLLDSATFYSLQRDAGVRVPKYKPGAHGKLMWDDHKTYDYKIIDVAAKPNARERKELKEKAEIAARPYFAKAATQKAKKT